MHVKRAVPRLMPEALSSPSHQLSAALTGNEGLRSGEGSLVRDVLVLSGWRETTPAVGTADNPAYDNNKVRQEYLVFLALPSTKHSLQSGEKTWHLRSLPCASSSRLFSCRATKRRRLHQTKPHLPKRSARTRPSSPAQLVFTHPQPCSPPSTAATYCLNTAHTLSPDVYTSQPPKMEGSGSNQEQGLDNAIRALREKKQVPEIDFTIHEMEDGSQVNTQERVCKGE